MRFWQRLVLAESGLAVFGVLGSFAFVWPSQAWGIWGPVLVVYGIVAGAWAMFAPLDDDRSWWQ